MIDIGVTGVGGRMGKTLAQCIDDASDLRLTVATEIAGSCLIGVDAGEVSGVGRSDVPVKDTLDDSSFDVLVDFSRPQAGLQHLDYCHRHGRRLVLGTTGFDASGLASIEAAAKDIAIVFAPNMSVGVNLSLELLKLCASVMGDSVDVEILEAHHRHKIDAPSGTALKMGEVIAGTLGRDLDQCAVYGRQGIGEERDRQTIGFSTMRGGDIVGEHTAFFIADGERIEITHKATSRRTFANGALRAARWLMGKDVGLFDMKDVLAL